MLTRLTHVYGGAGGAYASSVNDAGQIVGVDRVSPPHLRPRALFTHIAFRTDRQVPLPG